MKKAYNISLLFFVLLMFVKDMSFGQSIDKTDFYAALSSSKIEVINDQLAIIRSSSAEDKIAYEGVLLMKKSGMVSNAKEKLSLFKSGRSKLESSISRNNNNVEYRFFRVIIQEHAPKIVKYSNDLEQDCRMIIENFKTLSQALQQVITDYSRKSKVLKAP